jgi:hypothetical protein
MLGVCGGRVNGTAGQVWDKRTETVRSFASPLLCSMALEILAGNGYDVSALIPKTIEEKP